MKTYQITVIQGFSGTVKAENEEVLMKKLSTGHYGVLPPRGMRTIPFTPENVKEIVELIEESE